MEQWPTEHILPLQPPPAAAEPAQVKSPVDLEACAGPFRAASLSATGPTRFRLQVPAGGMRPGFPPCGPLMQALLHCPPDLSLRAQPALSEPAVVRSGRGRGALRHGSGRPRSTHSASEGGARRPRSLDAAHVRKRSRLEGEPGATRQRMRRPRLPYEGRGAGRRAAGSAAWPHARTSGSDGHAAGAASGLPGRQCRSQRHLEQLYISPDDSSAEGAGDGLPGRGGAARHRRSQHGEARLFLDGAAGTGGERGGAGSWTSDSGAASSGRSARSGSGARSSARPSGCADELGSADSRQTGKGPECSGSRGSDAAAAGASDGSRGPGTDELDRDFLADEGLAPDEAGTLRSAAKLRHGILVAWYGQHCTPWSLVQPVSMCMSGSSSWAWTRRRSAGSLRPRRAGWSK